jgi:uncharacterized protein YcbX
MEPLLLSGLYIYPIKSLGGISLTESLIETKGLKYDRRWMLIDEEGTFVSQRKHYSLALLQVSMIDDHIIITEKSAPDNCRSFSVNEHLDDPIRVSVWDDICYALEVKTELSQWFSDYLKFAVRLVVMPEQERRRVDPKYAHDGEVVSFADGYPSLLIGKSSLDALNERLENPVQMDRFRPNFVFSGGKPHEEDSIADFQLGGISFSAVKPCARCVLITIDQETGIKGGEPLKTLAGYRTRNNKIMFGQNLLHQGIGSIRIGQELEVTRRKPII